MRELASTGTSLARSVVLTARSSQVTFLAAAVAYYAFLSLVPLLALALVASAALGGEDVVEQLIGRFDAVLTPETEELLREALAGGTGRLGASVVGTVVVVWSALKVLRALDTAFSTIYGADTTESFARSVANAVVVLGGIPLGVGLTAAVPLVVRVFPLGPLQRTAAVLGGILTLTVVFVPMYVVFPNRRVSVRSAAPGAFVAALGWTLLGSAFSLYVAIAGGFALYGQLGGLLLLVMVLYVGALLLLLGATVNATLASDRQLQQAPNRQERVARTMSEDDHSDGEPTPGEPAGTGQPSETVSGPDRDDTEATAASERDVGDEATEFDPANRTPGDADWRHEVRELRGELESFRDDVEDRTVDRDAVEGDLKRYVRRRMRRGHARGWGPYLVLLYGTAMTIGAFYLLDDGWAILAMLVVWLSTLGLYALMVIVGFSLWAVGTPGRVRDVVGEWRS